MPQPDRQLEYGPEHKSNEEYAQADEASSPDGPFVDSGDDFLVAFNEAFYQLHILFVGAIEEVYHITDVERD